MVSLFVMRASKLSNGEIFRPQNVITDFKNAHDVSGLSTPNFGGKVGLLRVLSKEK